MASTTRFPLLCIQVYKQTVRVTNTLRSTVEATIKPGSAERWTVSPSSFKLKPGDSTDVELRLKVIKFAARQKAQQQGQRDLFHVKVSLYYTSQ